MNYKYINSRYYNFIIELAAFLAVSLIFISGIGRYRTVFVYVLYIFIRSIFYLIPVERIVNFSLLPFVAIAFYFDLVKGQMFPIYDNNYFFAVIIFMIILDKIIREYVKKILSKISNYEFFIICPFCHYNNKYLISNCLNCSYSKLNNKNLSEKTILTIRSGENINQNILKLIRLSDEEQILFHKKISSFLAVFKNGSRQIRKHFFITTKNIIFIDYNNIGFFIPSSLREIEIIPMTNIISIYGTMKKRHMSLQPFLTIKTINNDVYEMSFSHYGKYKDEINEISNIINDINSKIEIKIDVKEMPWKGIV